MCPSGYHHNDFVATDALGHIMYHTSCDHVPKCMSCHKVIVVITGRAHCFHDFMIAYIYHAHYMYIYIYIPKKVLRCSILLFAKSLVFFKSTSTARKLTIQSHL